jgi:hypothetical protein
VRAGGNGAYGKAREGARAPLGTAGAPRRGQRGSVLAGTMIFMFSLGFLTWGYLRVAGYEAEAVRARFEDARARWAAESALSQGLARIDRIAEPADKVYRAQDTGAYPTRYRIRPLPGARFPRWLISAYAYRNAPAGPELLCSLVVVVQAGSDASECFMCEDHFGGSYYFTGDTLDGPVHTNTRFAIAGSPVFLDSVFEMAGGVEGGFITDPGFPASPVLLKAKPRTGSVYRFDHLSRWIRQVDADWILRPDPGQVAGIAFRGEMMEIRYRDRNEPQAWSAPITRALPKAGGVFVDGEVEVKGVVGRTVTLGASGNIVITDDLVYADADPITARPREGSTTFLGLISERNVDVKQVQTREQKGRGIRIDAAVVAMDKSFQVINYRAHSWDMGTMHFWGSIIQVERGTIGALKANDSFRGYHKNWHYDRRLGSQPEALPYFPPRVSMEGFMRMTPVYWGPLRWAADV